MNIFVLDYNIERCARYHCDQHVVKMILEYAQVLCTSSNEHGLFTPYRSTHVKHPCVIWAGESIQNWRWLRELARALHREYHYRYGKEKDHQSYAVIQSLKEPDLLDIGLTEHPQAMPKKYKVPHRPVQAYRNFYIGAKSAFATWTRRKPPLWYRQALEKKTK